METGLSQWCLLGHLPLGWLHTHSLEVGRQQEHAPLDDEVHRCCLAQHVTHDPAFPALSTSRNIWILRYARVGYSIWSAEAHPEPCPSTLCGAHAQELRYTTPSSHRIRSWVLRCSDYFPLFQLQCSNVWSSVGSSSFPSKEEGK